jgi:hypothetical protein
MAFDIDTLFARAVHQKNPSLANKYEAEERAAIIEESGSLWNDEYWNTGSGNIADLERDIAGLEKHIEILRNERLNGPVFLPATLRLIKRFEEIAAGKRKILEDLRTSVEGFS